MIDNEWRRNDYQYMPIIVSRWLHPEEHGKRVYAGEPEADPLIDWLNRSRGSAEHKRLAGLIDGIQELISPQRDEEKEYELKERLNAILAKYRFWPSIWRERRPRRTWEMLWRSDNRDEEEGGEYGDTLSERDAIRDVCELVPARYIERVKRCRHCGKWFYAIFRHKEFCKIQCQQNHYRTSPEWKEKRRKWFRKYRQTLASGNVREREIQRRAKTDKRKATGKTEK